MRDAPTDSVSGRASSWRAALRIVGIDPGSRRTGYACLDCDDRGDAVVVEAGVIRLPRDAPIERRLVELDHDLSEIIRRLEPRRAAVEKLFAHPRRPLTAVTMGHARGVVLCALARADVEIRELGAAEVKKAVAGDGRAGKASMQEAVRAILRLAEPPSPDDVADALAIALCAARRGATAAAR